MLAFPKPKDVKKPKPAIRIFADGREVCDLTTKAGSDEYHRRKWEMRTRQNNRCCLEGHVEGCSGFLAKVDTTFEHEDGRTGGKRDDRIERLNPKTGKMEWINGAAHFWCNTRKGSRRVNYNDVP